jgi:hypothetical protein
MNVMHASKHTHSNHILCFESPEWYKIKLLFRIIMSSLQGKTNKDKLTGNLLNDVSYKIISITKTKKYIDISK